MSLHLNTATMTKLNVLIIFLFVTFLAKSQQALLPQTNGAIRAMVKKGDTLIFGGSFTKVFAPANSSAFGAFTDLSGAIIGNRAYPNGEVSCAISDRKNGVFIAGCFTQVGDSLRRGVAHIDSTGRVSAFLGGVVFNDTVTTILLMGNTLYVGGKFDSVSGFWRKGLAAVDLATNQLLAWNPQPNAAVRGLCGNGTNVYVMGDFTHIGGKNRIGLAALTIADSGMATSWNPNPNNKVNTMALSGDKLWIGGRFSAIGGTARNCIAAIHLKDTGTVTSWNPSAGLTGEVKSLAIDQGLVYVAGTFSYIGGGVHHQIAALDTGGNGQATSWAPNLGNTSPFSPHGITVCNQRVFVYGVEMSVTGPAKQFLKSYALTNGANEMAFVVPDLGMHINTIVPAQGGVYVGGSFGFIGGISRSNLAAWNLATNSFCSQWATWYGREVNALLLHNDSLFVGVGLSPTLIPSARLKIINAHTGLEFSRVSLSFLYYGTVNAIAVKDGFAYIGGVGLKTTSTDISLGLVRINLNTLKLDSVPHCDTTMALKFHGDELYVGGSFQRPGFAERQYLGILDVNTNQLKTWNPGLNGKVNTIVMLDSSLLIGGEFSIVNGEPRVYFGEVRLADATSTARNLAIDGPVYYMEKIDSFLYLTGSFGTVQGASRKKAASVELNSSLLSSWNPQPTGVDSNANTFISKVIKDGCQTLVGGDFAVLSGLSRANLGSLVAEGGNPQSYNMLNVSQNAHSVGPLDCVQNIFVYSNVLWRITQQSAWIHTQAFDTIGNGRVEIKCDSNLGPARIGYVVLEGAGIQRKITVFQAPVMLIAGPDTIDVPVDGRGPNLVITGNYFWEATFDQTWIESPITGAGSYLYYIMASPNNTFFQRTGTMTVTSGNIARKVYIRQAAMLPVLQVNKDSLVSGASGETVTVEVHCNGNWSVHASHPWIQLTSSQGSGDAIETIVLSLNDSNKARSGYVTFTFGTLSQSVWIYQYGQSTQLQLDKDTVHVRYKGDTINLQVNSDVLWQVAVGQSWILAAKPMGYGKQSASFFIAPDNQQSGRSGTIVFTAGTRSKSVYVIQDRFNTGLSSVEKEQVFKVYPNPAHTKLTIERTSTSDEVVEFYTPYGVLMFRQVLNESQTYICTDLWPAGLYYMRSRSSATSRGLPVLIVHE